MSHQVGESCPLCGFCLLAPIGNFVAFVKIRGKVRDVKGIAVSIKCIISVKTFYIVAQ